MERIIGFDPIVHENDKVLILGSMPSVESLNQNMYYANKTNRFWKMLARIYDRPADTLDDKLDLLAYAHIALWDICHSCLRHNSSDASIRKIEANDIDGFLKENPSIKTIICNGKTSYDNLCRYFSNLKGMAVVCPSTSAANARCRLDDLIVEYERILRK